MNDSSLKFALQQNPDIAGSIFVFSINLEYFLSKPIFKGENRHYLQFWEIYEDFTDFERTVPYMTEFKEMQTYLIPINENKIVISGIVNRIYSEPRIYNLRSFEYIKEDEYDFRYHFLALFKELE